MTFKVGDKVVYKEGQDFEDKGIVQDVAENFIGVLWEKDKTLAYARKENCRVITPLDELL